MKHKLTFALALSFIAMTGCSFYEDGVFMASERGELQDYEGVYTGELTVFVTENGETKEHNFQDIQCELSVIGIGNDTKDNLLAYIRMDILKFPFWMNGDMGTTDLSIYDVKMKYNGYFSRGDAYIRDWAYSDRRPYPIDYIAGSYQDSYKGTGKVRLEIRGLTVKGAAGAEFKIKYDGWKPYVPPKELEGPIEDD